MTAPLQSYPELYGGHDPLVEEATILPTEREQVVLLRIYHEVRTELPHGQVRVLLANTCRELVESRIERLWEENLGRFGA